jgi:hypothetical protein
LLRAHHREIVPLRVVPPLEPILRGVVACELTLPPLRVFGGESAVVELAALIAPCVVAFSSG